MSLSRLHEGVNHNDLLLFLDRALSDARFEEALTQLSRQSLEVLTALHKNSSVLHLSARHGWLEGVQYLIEQRRVNIHLVNLNNESAIHHVLSANQWAVADYLVRQGANLECCDTQGVGLLSLIAAQPANLPALQALWSQCAANVQERLLETRNLLGKTPLHIAAMQGSVELVTWFVDELQKNHCATPYALVDKAGYTPLHEAAQYGHVAVCNYLMSLGADPYVLNINGDAPIHLSSHNNVTVSLHQNMRVAFPVFAEEAKDDAGALRDQARDGRLWSEEQYQLR